MVFCVSQEASLVAGRCVLFGTTPRWRLGEHKTARHCFLCDSPPLAEIRHALSQPLFIMCRLKIGFGFFLAVFILHLSWLNLWWSWTSRLTSDKSDEVAERFVFCCGTHMSLIKILSITLVFVQAFKFLNFFFAEYIPKFFWNPQCTFVGRKLS